MMLTIPPTSGGVDFCFYVFLLLSSLSTEVEVNNLTMKWKSSSSKHVTFTGHLVVDKMHTFSSSSSCFHIEDKQHPLAVFLLLHWVASISFASLYDDYDLFLTKKELFFLVLKKWFYSTKPVLVLLKIISKTSNACALLRVSFRLVV